MKRSLLLIVILICSFVVFAENNGLSVSVIPYGMQFSTSSERGQNCVRSNVGLGAELAYQRFTDDFLFVEGGLGWNTFLLKDKDPRAFTALMFFGGVGLRYPVFNNCSVVASVDACGDTLIYNKTGSETFTVKTGVGVDYSYSERFSLTIKCTGSFGFAKEDDIDYVNYRILPTLSGVFYF